LIHRTDPIGSAILAFGHFARRDPVTLQFMLAACLDWALEASVVVAAGAEWLIQPKLLSRQREMVL